MKLKEDVKPITFLKNNAARLVQEVAEHRRTVTITQNGQAKAVLIDVETYDRWRDTLSLMKMVSQGEADISSGRAVSQDEAFARAARVIDETPGDG